MTDEAESLFCPLEFRYGRDIVRNIFSRGARLERALRVEAALALSESELGMIPADVGSAIDAAANLSHVSLARVDELERSLRHDVMAMTRALAEAAGPAGRWVHFGATSADITDTAQALELKESAGILRNDLTTLARTLADLARKHRATAEVGRTHGQHGVPLSFGYKIAVAAAEVTRHRDRLDQLLPRLAVGKMAGAVGTGAGFGSHAAELETLVMRRLGLTPDEAPTQIVGRDRIAEFTNLLALIAATAERLATEVRNLQRTEIAEVSEPFDEARQVGSSTMAQKRNPMVSENVTSLARLVRAFALPPLENMVQWHERDLANSANERIVLPHAIVLTDDYLTKLTEVFRGLRVDSARMSAELARSAGGSMTENLMLALTLKGIARSEAHELLRALTSDPAKGPPLLDRAKESAVVRAHLTPSEIEELLDPESYVRAAAAKTDRILADLDRRLGA
ncbi:MAG TPA: adenylosuccinate lyase [Thermoplasmata archaeon]|nr:adenylosuccinate lyase [Thermoplasmata archaeon]